MPTLSLAEAFRYLLSGLVGLLYLLVYDREQAQNIVNAVGVVGLLGAALPAGVLLYVSYRAFLYNVPVVWLQDVFRRSSNSHRTYLMRQYGISRREAVRLYTAIRDTEFKDFYPSVAVPAAQVHYTYLASFLAIPFAVLAAFEGRCYMAIFFGGASVVLFCAAFLYDRRFEDEELILLLQVAPEKVNAAVLKVNAAALIVKRTSGQISACQ